VTNVVVHIDYMAKLLHNRNKYFVQWIHEHHHPVQIYIHQHVVVDIVVVVVVDCMDIDNLVVIEDHKLVVVVLVDIEYLNLLHIPMVHIFHNILQVKPRRQNLFHNWVYYKHDDHNLDLQKTKKVFK
jgi:hypothetical protein